MEELFYHSEHLLTFKKRHLTVKQSLSRRESSIQFLLATKKKKKQANSWLVQFYVNLCSPPLSEIVTGNLRHPGSGPHLLAQLLVLGFQALAVATPWSVELNQNIFAVVIDDGVKVLCHHNLQTEDTCYGKASGWYGKASGSWMLSPQAR